MKQFLTSGLGRSVISLVLCGALILSLGLPLLGVAAAVPEDPISEDQIQEITVLHAANQDDTRGIGESRPTDTDGTAGAVGGSIGNQGGNAPDSQSETPTEEPKRNEDHTDTQQKSNGAELPDLSQTQIGTAASDDPTEGQGDEATNEAKGNAELDLGLVLTWKKYGVQSQTVVCPADETVGKTIPQAQVRNGRFAYELDFCGVNAPDAKLLSVSLANGSGEPLAIPQRGDVGMELPEDMEACDYVFFVEAEVTCFDETGGKEIKEVSFCYVLRYEQTLDMDLSFRWQQKDGGRELICQANRGISAELSGSSLSEPELVYSMSLSSENLRNLEVTAVQYSCVQTGERNISIEPSGHLALTVPEGKEYAEYEFRITGQGEQINGDGTTSLLTASYSVRLVYRDVFEPVLQLTWYDKDSGKHTVPCPQKGVEPLVVKKNQIVNNELQYSWSFLEESDQARAEIIAPKNREGVLKFESDREVYELQAKVQIQSREEPRVYTLPVRYVSDVSLLMNYQLKDGTRKSITCENKKQKEADLIYDDALDKDSLKYSMEIDGEDKNTVRISRVELFQSGNMQTSEVQTEGAVNLLLNQGTTGENRFTVYASDDTGTEYQFQINIPYKHKGQKIIQIEHDIDSNEPVPNETENSFKVKASWTDENGNVQYVLDSGTDGNKLTLTMINDEGIEERCWLSGRSAPFIVYKYETKNPSKGDTNTHTLTIRAENEFGDWGEETVVFTGERGEAGKPLGTATIVIDMSVVGLGIRELSEYEVKQDEPISYSIAKAVWGYDAGEPFGASEQSFAWPSGACSYDGTLDSGFYLQALDDGSGLGAQATVYEGIWNENGNDPSVLKAIDEYFGEDNPYAALWRCIYRNGLGLNSRGSGLREFDFAQGSGWLISRNGTYIPEGASNFSLQKGDTLVLRYTLAYGNEMGYDAGMGNTVGYCVNCAYGISVSHRWEAVTDESGQTVRVCHCCGKTEGCLHENTKWEQISEEGCQEKCSDCGKLLGEPEEHLMRVVDEAENPDNHHLICENCGFEVSGAHEWVEDEAQPNCTDVWHKTWHCECEGCGAVKEEEMEPTGHQPDGRIYSDEKESWQVCGICHQEIPNSRTPLDADHEHGWVYDPGWGDWVCDCGQLHGYEACGVSESELELIQETDGQYVYRCPVCGEVLYKPIEETAVDPKEETPDEGEPGDDPSDDVPDDPSAPIDAEPTGDNPLEPEIPGEQESGTGGAGTGDEESGDEDAGTDNGEGDETI